MFYTVLCCLAFHLLSFSQTDTTKNPVRTDSLVKVAPPLQNRSKADSVRKAFSPKKATIRSAILPGWRQAYNKKYWKIPLVYGALGTTGVIFFYNMNTYRDLRFAYKAKFEASTGDSTNYRNIKPELVPLDMNALRTYRDEFRSNIDYSVLFFLLFWGLNVVDATVDAHLKLFDVNPDLSFKLKFGPSKMAGTTGLSLVLALKGKNQK